MSQNIHRANLLARPACGAISGRISTSGIAASITCPACLAAMQPAGSQDAAAIIAESLRQARAAVAARRA